MKSRKLLSLVLACLMLVAIFASCANETETPTQTPSTATSAPPQSTGTDTPPEEVDDVNRLPIVDEKVTFTCWTELLPHYQQYMSSYNDTVGYQQVEKATNIHIDWLHPSSVNAGEAFNLLIASREYPDFINGFSSMYKAGLDAAVQDDVIIELNEVIDQYIPNYSRLLDDRNVRKDVITDSGLMGELFLINNVPQDAAFGFMVRQDWLEELNIPTPVTYDDWYNMLIKFRDEKGAKSPMLLNNQYACDSPYNNYKAGYQTSWTFFNQDGQVKYGPITPEYKDWLAMMAKWYSEGLIDQEFTARDNSVFFILDQAQMFNGDSGIWFGAPRGNYTGATAFTSGFTTDENWYCMSVRNPVLKEGDKMHFRAPSLGIGPGSVITPTCEDVPTLAKWFNYCYSDAGSLDLCYGIEGESFVFNSDGEPELQTQWFADTYGLDDFSTTRHLVGPLGFAGFSFVTLKNADQPLRPSYQVEATEILMRDSNDWAMPNFMSPTQEETTELSAIMNDIETYVQERTTRVIMGVETVDSYDDAIARIMTMKIDRALELQQAAVDRYLARGN